MFFSRGRFKCLDGSTIPAASHCDGLRDCADGSDETVRSCAAKTCPSYLFQCAYGACVDSDANCNQVRKACAHVYGCGYKNVVKRIRIEGAIDSFPLTLEKSLKTCSGTRLLQACKRCSLNAILNPHKKTRRGGKACVRLVRYNDS